MAKRTYSETVDKILEKLNGATIAPGGGAALLIRLDGIDKRQEETVELLRQLNGCVREHGELLAAHSEWMHSHQSIHKALDKQTDSLSRRINVLSGVNGLLAVIAGALGIAPNN